MLSQLSPSDYIALYAAIVATLVGAVQFWQQINKKPKLHLKNEFSFSRSAKGDGLVSQKPMSYSWSIFLSNRGANSTTILKARIEKRRWLFLIFYEVLQSRSLNPLIRIGFSQIEKKSAVDSWLPITLESGNACVLNQIISADEIEQWNIHSVYLVLTVSHRNTPVSFRLPMLTDHIES